MSAPTSSPSHEAAQALILSDRQMYGGTGEKTILDVFVRRGILKSALTKRAGYDPFGRQNRPRGR